MVGFDSIYHKNSKTAKRKSNTNLYLLVHGRIIFPWLLSAAITAAHIFMYNIFNIVDSREGCRIENFKSRVRIWWWPHFIFVNAFVVLLFGVYRFSCNVWTKITSINMNPYSHFYVFCVISNNVRLYVFVLFIEFRYGK